MKVGIIGYGAIAQDLVHRLLDQAVPGVEIVAVLNRARTGTERGVTFTTQFSEFMAMQPNIVIEAAGQGALKQYGLQVLERGCSLAVVSVGALVDADFHAALRRQAEEQNVKVYFPSGAIAGLDRIAAAREGQLTGVHLTTRKPPLAWVGTEVEAQVDLFNLQDPVCVYRGFAPDAARRFPESVNVSAALGLAGVGMERTYVEVWVDPGVVGNEHHVTATGDFGSFTCTVRNTPSGNPKTGVIVAMSLIKLLRNLADPFVIGV